MTNQHFQALPAAKRRRLIFWAVLRSVLAAVVLVVLYYVLPLDRRWDADTAIRLLIGIVVFAGVMVSEVRAIAGSRYPGLRAAEALGLILPLFLVLFASTYFVMERASAASFTEPLTRTDALYFTVTVFSTVGFGDITAKSEAARWCSSSRCSPTSHFWVPAYECSWGRCNAAGYKARVRAMTPGRRPGNGLSGAWYRVASLFAGALRSGGCTPPGRSVP